MTTHKRKSKNAQLNGAGIGIRIDERRRELGLTVADLAHAAGVTRTAVYLWIHGTSKALKAAALIRIAEILKVTPQWLETGQGKKESGPLMEITDAEHRFLEIYQPLTDAQKDTLLAFVKSMGKS